jgi:hypothetical protein
MSDGGTQGGRRSGPLVVPVQASEGAPGGKSPGVCPEGRWRGKSSTEVADPALPRKASSQEGLCPYCKPTQVGDARSVRRAGEPLLRNSAKSPRNFGRRGAPVGCHSPRGPQRNSPSDCLPKTQVSAKAQADV